MASAYYPTLVKVQAGTGAAANIVAATAAQSARIWQIIISGTANDTATIAFTAAGASSSVKVSILANTSAILPMTGVPWAIGDVNTAITVNAVSTTTVTSYYTLGVGG